LKISAPLPKVEGKNPLIWYDVAVKNADGTLATWATSGGAPEENNRCPGGKCREK
jgi:hypothetical protein